MAIEKIPSKGGRHGKAKIICDDCGKEDCVPCAYVGVGGARNENQRPNESQARAKALQLGWAYVKNKLRCPTCEAKRKVIPMKQPTKTEAPEPTKKERIQIFAMLADVYDVDAGRYAQGDTDETVADVLGVRPGFVAQIREAEFGPDGGNEDIDALAAKIDDMLREMKGIKGDCEAIIKDAQSIIDNANFAFDSNKKKLAEVTALKADLEKIKKAVGPRILKAAGVN